MKEHFLFYIELIFNEMPISRHAVGTSWRRGQYVVKAIGPCRNRPCLGVATKTAVDGIWAPPIRWAFPGNQRLGRALLAMKGTARMKDNSSQEPSPTHAPMPYTTLHYNTLRVPLFIRGTGKSNDSTPTKTTFTN